jgi:hypothetical protein
MEQPEQEVVEQTVSTNLPRLETTVRAPSTTPGTTIFDVQNVSIWYGSFKAVTDVSLPVYETRSPRSSARPVAASRPCCAP